MSDEIKLLTSNKQPVTELRKKALAEGMTPLKHDAWSKVLEGITTIDEAIRITGSLD